MGSDLTLMKNDEEQGAAVRTKPMTVRNWRWGLKLCIVLILICVVVFLATVASFISIVNRFPEMESFSVNPPPDSPAIQFDMNSRPLKIRFHLDVKVEVKSYSLIPFDIKNIQIQVFLPDDESRKALVNQFKESITILPTQTNSFTFPLTAEITGSPDELIIRKFISGCGIISNKMEPIPLQVIVTADIPFIGRKELQNTMFNFDCSSNDFTSKIAGIAGRIRDEITKIPSTMESVKEKIPISNIKDATETVIKTTKTTIEANPETASKVKDNVTVAGKSVAEKLPNGVKSIPENFGPTIDTAKDFLGNHLPKLWT